MEAVRAVSIQSVPSRQRKVTQNCLAVTIPVERVPAALKFVPNVKTRAVVPVVVMTNVTVFPTRLVPLELKVHGPVGVMVMIELAARLTVIAPVAAGAGAVSVATLTDSNSTMVVVEIGVADGDAAGVGVGVGA